MHHTCQGWEDTDDFICVGHAGSAIALIGVAYSGCNTLMTVLFLIVSVTLTSACLSGFMVSYVDCTPNYVGIILGVVNTLANIGGIGAPYVTGLFINDNVSSKIERFTLLFDTCILVIKSFNVILAVNAAVFRKLEFGLLRICRYNSFRCCFLHDIRLR